MAIAARHGTVSAYQRELCFGMIEAVDVCPGLYVVAGLAAEGRAIGAFAGHAVVELALVRILMASRACAVFKMEGKDFVDAAASPNFMAIGARDRDMGASQGEARGFVLGDCECRAMEIDHGMTRFAAIVVRSGGKLIVVRILVAIGASFKFNFVDGVFARGSVALRAFHLDVFAFERVAGRVVFFYAE